MAQPTRRARSPRFPDQGLLLTDWSARRGAVRSLELVDLVGGCLWIGDREHRGAGEPGGKALGAALGLRVDHALTGSEAQSTATMANESLHRQRAALRALCFGVRRSFMLWGGACSACSCSKESVRVSLAGGALGNVVRQ